MEIESLACNNCGGPLQVPQSAKYAKCNHCGSQLAIRRTESATYTEQLDAIETKQDELIEKIDRLERINRIALLDREWEQEQSQFMITRKNGRQHLPDDGSMLGSFLVAGFGVFWTLMAGSMFPPFALFGVIFIVGAIASGFSAKTKADNYQKAKRRYEKLRHELSIDPETLREIEAQEDATSPVAFLAQMEREGQ